MQILPLNFLICTWSGVWRPSGWSSSGVKILYNLFSFYAIMSMYFFMLSQFMDIVLVVDNMDDFTNNSLIFVTVVVVCCKTTVALTRRNAIVDLVQTLSKDPFNPRNEDEMAIQMKFEKLIRSFTTKFLLLAVNALVGFVVRSVLNVMQGQLPCRVWLPFDPYTSPTFWIVSVQQVVSLAFGNFMSVGIETLIFGFFFLTCAQLEIFETRLHRSVLNKVSQYPEYISASPNNEETTISNYVSHHLKIYEYARTINSTFNEIFFVQFFGSTLVLCTCVYYLSTHISESEFAALILYTVTVFVQIFLYCWSGNEVALKSASVSNVIYHMDWPSLSSSDRRDLLMIMRRCTVPIKFTSGFLITLSLESYSNIMKMSYSAFNMLQRS